MFIVMVTIIHIVKVVEQSWLWLKEIMFTDIWTLNFKMVSLVKVQCFVDPAIHPDILHSWTFL